LHTVVVELNEATTHRYEKVLKSSLQRTKETAFQQLRKDVKKYYFLSAFKGHARSVLDQAIGNAVSSPILKAAVIEEFVAEIAEDVGKGLHSWAGGVAYGVYRLLYFFSYVVTRIFDLVYFLIAAVFCCTYDLFFYVFCGIYNNLPSIIVGLLVIFIILLSGLAVGSNERGSSSPQSSYSSYDPLLAYLESSSDAYYPSYGYSDTSGYSRSVAAEWRAAERARAAWVNANRWGQAWNLYNRGGYTQTEIGRMMGCSQSTVSRHFKKMFW